MAEWLHIMRASVVMETSAAKRELQWSPEHTSAQTLVAMVAVL